MNKTVRKDEYGLIIEANNNGSQFGHDAAEKENKL